MERMYWLTSEFAPSLEEELADWSVAVVARVGRPTAVYSVEQAHRVRRSNVVVTTPSQGVHSHREVTGKSPGS